MKYRIVKKHEGEYIFYYVEVFVNTGIIFKHMEWAGEYGWPFLTICKTEKEAKQVIKKHKAKRINDAKSDKIIEVK